MIMMVLHMLAKLRLTIVPMGKTEFHRSSPVYTMAKWKARDKGLLPDSITTLTNRTESVTLQGATVRCREET